MRADEVSRNVNERELYRSILNDKIYRLSRLVDPMAVLDSLDGTSQIMTEKGNLKLFYRHLDAKDTGLPGML